MVAAGAGPELERGDRQTEEPGWGQVPRSVDPPLSPARPQRGNNG